MTEPAIITRRCSQCNESQRIPIEFLGKRIVCRRCERQGTRTAITVTRTSLACPTCASALFALNEAGLNRVICHMCNVEMNIVLQEGSETTATHSPAPAVSDTVAAHATDALSQAPETMSSFDRGAREWLGLYINTDRDWIRRFSEGMPLERAEAVRQAAHAFSVGRNFPACDLQGAEKHLRTVEELEATDPDAFGDDIASLVLDLERRFVIRHQSNRIMLSAASKLLWMKHPGRSIIIDNQAATVLGFSSVGLDMYRDYVAAWQARYAAAKKEIAAACDSMLTTPGQVPEEIKDAVSEEWFRQRAFDLYLWQTGGS
jgi:hypothetical protein